MGIPQNYSLDLPTRCLALLDGLWDIVASDEKMGLEHGGPLSTTFLLALATPIITLPTERILKQHPKIEGAVDDWHLDLELARRLRLNFIAEDTFGNCPFFDSTHGWSYARYDKLHNFARGVPNEIEAHLETLDARSAAAALPAARAILAMRNALAHGSITYLDAKGNSSFGNRAENFALISERRDQAGEVIGFHILRISEAGFRSFLHRWVDWLNDSGVAEAMAA
jgi:hypothetical protein